MSRLLFIAVRRLTLREPADPDDPPGHHDRRLYNTLGAAWTWLKGYTTSQLRHTVFEVDLDECVQLREEDGPSYQTRYEHAERRATRWLGLMQRLEPFVKLDVPKPPPAAEILGAALRESGFSPCGKKGCMFFNPARRGSGCTCFAFVTQPAARYAMRCIAKACILLAERAAGP